MKKGSEVYIVSGTHKGLKGKITAIIDNAQNMLRQQKRVMGEDAQQDEIDEESYITVELE